MKTNDLAANLLHELFEYKDGKLYWKQPGKSRQMAKHILGMRAPRVGKIQLQT